MPMNNGWSRAPTVWSSCGGFQLTSLNHFLHPISRHAGGRREKRFIFQTQMFPSRRVRFDLCCCYKILSLIVISDRGGWERGFGGRWYGLIWWYRWYDFNKTSQPKRLRCCCCCRVLVDVMNNHAAVCVAVQWWDPVLVSLGPVLTWEYSWENRK